MEKERVNLFVTKEQLELIFDGIKDRRLLWERTLEHFEGSKSAGRDIEECSDEEEAGYMKCVHDRLYDDLKQKVDEVGVNTLESLSLETLTTTLGKAEVMRVFRGDWERVVYVYTARESNYLLFISMSEMASFFDIGREPEHQFTSEAELHAFLRYWKG